MFLQLGYLSAAKCRHIDSYLHLFTCCKCIEKYKSDKTFLVTGKIPEEKKSITLVLIVDAPQPEPFRQDSVPLRHFLFYVVTEASLVVCEQQRPLSGLERTRKKSADVFEEAALEAGSAQEVHLV